MQLDDLLKDPALNISEKKSILAKWLKSKDLGQDCHIILSIGSFAINYKQNQITKTVDYKIDSCNESKDYELLLLKFQCNQLLSMGKSTLTYKFYCWRLLRDFICRYPANEPQDLMSRCLTAQKMFITKIIEIQVKTEVYQRQLCEICGKEPIQFCAVCKLTYYCSANCQTKDWQKHKISCHVFH